MRRVSSLLVGSLLAIGFGGCTFSPGPAGSSAGNTGSGASSGTGTGNGASSGTGRGASSGTGQAGNGEFGTEANCGQATFGTQNLPGDLLIVQDKSQSMSQSFTDGQCNGQNCKWQTTVTALEAVVMATQGMINWGLKYFANAGACGVNPGVAIAPAPNNSAAITASLNGNQPGGNTPTRFAVQSAVAYLRTLTDQNPKYILLATDGEPNCCTTAGGVTCPPPPAMGGANGTTDDQNTINAVMAANAAGFPVFVVGVGTVAGAVATLNSMATAGGRAQPADAMGRVFFPATDQAALEKALATISGQIKSCTFNLTSTPPDPNN